VGYGARWGAMSAALGWKEVITYNGLNYLPDMQHHKQYISDEV